MSEANKKSFLGETKGERTVSIVALVLAIVLIPILVLNTVLILKNAFHPDTPPAIGKLTPLIVLTESMELKIHDGDLILARVTAIEDIEEDAVISYFDPASKSKSVVTHRITEKYEENGKVFFVTKGDNNNIEDKYPVPAENVIGVWTGFRLPYMGRVMMFMQSTWGLLICIGLPVIAFVVAELLHRKQKDKASRDDINALKAELEALKKAKAEGEADGE